MFIERTIISGMNNVDQNKLQYIWGQLSVKEEGNMDRYLKALSEYGDYASWNVSKGVSEVLLKLTEDWLEAEMPNWEGMGFSVERIQVDSIEKFVVMELLESKLEVPFACFCADVVNSLVEVMPDQRKKTLTSVIDMWDQFFTQSKDTTLSKPRQRGLYAELFWLRKLIESKMKTEAIAVDSWKGCEKSVQDFEDKGEVVEVKSTITKEPRKITISNERQLDDDQLKSLHLFVLTLDVHETGESLPDIVQDLSNLLSQSTSTNAKFKRKLLLASYVETDSAKYRNRYTKRYEELFKVQQGFPRIIALPKGTGDLKHSVQISACMSYQCGIEDYFGVGS